MSDSLCGSSQHCNSTPEQSVAAQSQHHQQYIGTDRGLVGSLNSCLSTDVSNLRSRTSASFMTHLFFFQKPVFLSDGWPHFFSSVCRYVSHLASVSLSRLGHSASAWAHQHDRYQKAADSLQRPLWGMSYLSTILHYYTLWPFETLFKFPSRDT